MEVTDTKIRIDLENLEEIEVVEKSEPLKERKLSKQLEFSLPEIQ
jgi:hypothetical protein